MSVDVPKGDPFSVVAMSAFDGEMEHCYIRSLPDWIYEHTPQLAAQSI
jgi:hypothetical protein